MEPSSLLYGHPVKSIKQLPSLRHKTKQNLTKTLEKVSKLDPVAPDNNPGIQGSETRGS